MKVHIVLTDDPSDDNPVVFINKEDAEEYFYHTQDYGADWYSLITDIEITTKNGLEKIKRDFTIFADTNLKEDDTAW